MDFMGIGSSRKSSIILKLKVQYPKTKPPNLKNPGNISSFSQHQYLTKNIYFLWIKMEIKDLPT